MTPRHQIAKATDLLLATAIENDGRWRGRLIRRALLRGPEVHDCDVDDASEDAAIERARALAEEWFPLRSQPGG